MDLEQKQGIAVICGYGKRIVCGYGVGIRRYKKSGNPYTIRISASGAILDKSEPNAFSMSFKVIDSVLSL